MQVYTYVKTMAVGKQFGSRWTDRVMATETLLSLCTNERTAILVLFNTVAQEQQAFSIEGLRNTSIDKTQTINQFLANNGNYTLPTTPVPVIKPRLVRYISAVRGGYKPDTVKIGYADDADLPRGLKTDLKLTREGVDYADFERNCLVSINGYFHKSVANSNGVYVPEAMKSVEVCGYNGIGIYNFRAIGSISQHALADAIIHPVAQSIPLHDQLTIQLPVSAEGKFAVFFIGGYMVPCGSGFLTQLNDTTFTMSFNYFRWMDKFFEMSRFLDLKQLGLLASPTNEKAFYKNEITSDRTIRNLFKMPQSFVALVDTPSFFVDKSPLAITKLPGIYRDYGNSIGLPLQLGHGRLAEYWRADEDGQQASQAIMVADGYKFQRTYNSADASAAIVVDPKRPAGHRIDFSDAFLLSMGRDF